MEEQVPVDIDAGKRAVNSVDGEEIELSQENFDTLSLCNIKTIGLIENKGRNSIVRMKKEVYEAMTTICSYYWTNRELL